VVGLIAQKSAEFRKSFKNIKGNFWRDGMTTLAVKLDLPYAEKVRVTEDSLNVDLSDGRTISVPLTWFPRLVHATREQRDNWRLIGRGHGIHWDDIDEDVSVEGIIAGRPSGESQSSFKKWLEERN